MALTRLQLLPQCHPGARMLSVSGGVPGNGWVATVRHGMDHSDPRVRIVDILSHPDFAEDVILEARSCKSPRKLLLKRFRTSVVFPALRERD